MAPQKIVALSTMWGIGRYQNMAPFVDKVREMGFSHIELNYQVTGAMLDELKGCPDLAVSSVHSPCPGQELPDGRWTYRLRMTSQDSVEREPALQSAMDTIDTAVAMGAPVMVVHVGSVPLQDGLEPRLRDMYRNGDAGTPEFRELRDRLLADRDNRKAPYLDAAYDVLRRIVSCAKERGIRVGLESRFYFHEIPNLEEARAFLSEFGGAVGYWHDFGHCENLARLGFTPHRDWLETLGTRMIGTHIHDVIGIADHKAPGMGTLDLGTLSSYLPEDAIRVCELASANTEEQVREGLALLKRAGIA